jgi:hypothetical protein
MPIREKFLYGLVKIETSPWSSPFTWTDRTADLVAGINYSEGGRIGTPGASQVDPGTLNATFKNLSSVPVVGNLVRVSFTDFAGYAFTGYVQDVSQRIVFDQSVSLTTPVTLTTINCLDWVGYISQFQAVGVGGANFLTGVDETDSIYPARDRVAALNKIVDSSYNTKIILGSLMTVVDNLGDTDFVGSFAQHLDLIATTINVNWRGNHALPTNVTTGRTSLVSFDPQSVFGNETTFTDAVGTAGQLHYTEIDLLNSTSNVANTIVVNNRVRFNVPDVEVTKIGGFNEENFMIINNQNVVGLAIDGVQELSDTTSITTYGIRQTVVDTNVAMPVSSSGSFNIIVNPSMEYSDDGYTRNNLNCVVRRRKPSQDANPFAAYNGLWAMRSRQIVASATARILFSGGEADGIPVVAGSTYYFKGYAARGTTSRTDMRAKFDVRWYDDAESLLSTTSTSFTTLTTANTWYLVSGSAAAPANAVRATIEMLFERSGGGNITIGDRLWADAFMFSKTTDAYFDGDTPWDSTNAYAWTGGVGASPSYKLLNNIDSVGNTLLAYFANTSLRVTRIRWNAQEDLSAVPKLVVGQKIYVVYKGNTTAHKIVGIDGNIDPSRYMIDYYLQKV